MFSSTRFAQLLAPLVVVAAVIAGGAHGVSECRGAGNCSVISNKTLCAHLEHCQWNASGCSGQGFDCGYIQPSYCESISGCMLHEGKESDIFLIIGICSFVIIFFVIVGFFIKIIHDRIAYNKNRPMFGEIDESAYDSDMGTYNPPERKDEDSSDPYNGAVIH